MGVQVFLLLCITHPGRGGAAVAGLPSGGAVQAEVAGEDCKGFRQETAGSHSAQQAASCCSHFSALATEVAQGLAVLTAECSSYQ